MLDALLTAADRELIAAERSLLTDTATWLAANDAPAEDREALRESAAQLDLLFMLVVVGEFNAGKSAFLNALLGRPVLRVGVTPTTAGHPHPRVG